MRHKVATTYQPKTSGLFKVSNKEVKQILQKIMNATRKDLALKLVKALWAYRTMYKTYIGIYPYQIMFGKACYLPVELEYQAYWAIKNLNLDVELVGRMRIEQIQELDKFKLHEYEKAKLYKKKRRRYHVKHIVPHTLEPCKKSTFFTSKLNYFQ